MALEDEAVKALRSCLKKTQDEGFDPEQIPIVFPNLQGGHLRRSNFDIRVWYPIRMVAGIADTFVFHDLGHTQASLLLAAGVDSQIIQKQFGHRDYSPTANTSSHLLQNAQNEAVDKLLAMLKQRTKSRQTESWLVSNIGVIKRQKKPV